MVLRALTILVAIPFFYLVFGLFGGLVPGAVANVHGGPVVEIGLARGPIHYDFLLPLTDDIRQRFAFAEAAGVPISHPKAKWVVVGWGARQFYMRTDRPAIWRLARWPMPLWATMRCCGWMWRAMCGALRGCRCCPWIRHSLTRW